MMKRIIMIAMALSMLLSVSAFASSAQMDKVFDSNEAIDLGPNDPNAILLDAVEPDPYAPKTRASSLLFSFTGQTVYEMLATNASNKTFTKAGLTNGNLKISGTGKYSSKISGATFRAGACYYNSSSQSFITYPSQYHEFADDTYGTRTMSKDEFSSGTTYYGFMTNLIRNGVTYLSGTFYLYNAS